MGKIYAIIFDLDGTLTKPILDFDLIRREIGIEKGPVWEAILQMSSESRKSAEEILLRHEMDAANNCVLQPNALTLLGQLSKKSIMQGVLTRNSRCSWEIVRDRFGLSIDFVYAREDGPMKPDPVTVLNLTRQMKVEPAETLVVGDYLFDIQAGRSAGAATALLVNHHPVPDYASLADYVIHDLIEIMSIV